MVFTIVHYTVHVLVYKQNTKGHYYYEKVKDFVKWWLLEKPFKLRTIYLLLVYLVTALVPSDTACFDSSPGRWSLTAVWISLLEIVCFLL